jgi:hypothetical protein
MGGKDRKGKYHRGELFQLIETLSVLCAAPSGAGKTASFVTPTIAVGDAASVVVHDCKPGLWADAPRPVPIKSIGVVSKQATLLLKPQPRKIEASPLTFKEAMLLAKMKTKTFHGRNLCVIHALAL